MDLGVPGDAEAWRQGLWRPNASKTAHVKYRLVGLPDFYKALVSFFFLGSLLETERLGGCPGVSVLGWPRVVRRSRVWRQAGSPTSTGEQKRKEGGRQLGPVGRNNRPSPSRPRLRDAGPTRWRPSRREPGRPRRVANEGCQKVLCICFSRARNAGLWAAAGPAGEAAGSVREVFTF